MHYTEKAEPKKVIIEIKSTQRFTEGSEDHMEIVTEGTGHLRQGISYFIYRESELSGIEGVTTSLRVDGESVILNRMGAVELKQEFKPQVLYHSTYVTPLGSFFLSVLTTRLESYLTGCRGRISLEYDLFVDEEFVSHNSLKINIKEETLNESLRED